MKIDWSIKTIKQWPDGTWDALLESTQDGRKIFDRVLSEDGYNWTTKYRKKALDEIQDELTRCMGDMVDHGIKWVVF